MHTYESRGCGDISVWFPGPRHLPSPLSHNYYAAIGSFSHRTSFKFLLFLCGPWETTVLYKCRLPYSLAQSFYIKSLVHGRVAALCVWGEGGGVRK
jgi:hypothetical protein